MFAEWLAECAADDPALLVPWSSPENRLAFVNLRDNPYDLAEVSEAERFPALARALRALNATRSPFLTAKCDVWLLSASDQDQVLKTMRLELDLEESDSIVGLGSYVDLLWRERNVFASPHQQSDRLERLVRRAEKLHHPETALQFVMRPALVDFGNPLEGFCTTMYITSLGSDSATAKERWEAALEAVVHTMRHRDLEPPRGSATIDS